jgi:hypothetical protein
MKTLLLVLSVTFSLNTFSSEVGEDQKAPCIYADQSAKRDAKVVEAPVSDIKKDESGAVSK